LLRPPGAGRFRLPFDTPGALSFSKRLTSVVSFGWETNRAQQVCAPTQATAPQSNLWIRNVLRRRRRAAFQDLEELIRCLGEHRQLAASAVRGAVGDHAFRAERGIFLGHAFDRRKGDAVAHVDLLGDESERHGEIHHQAVAGDDQLHTPSGPAHLRNQVAMGIPRCAFFLEDHGLVRRGGQVTAADTTAVVAAEERRAKDHENRRETDNQHPVGHGSWGRTWGRGTVLFEGFFTAGNPDSAGGEPGKIAALRQRTMPSPQNLAASATRMADPFRSRTRQRLDRARIGSRPQQRDHEGRRHRGNEQEAVTGCEEGSLPQGGPPGGRQPMLERCEEIVDGVDEPRAGEHHRRV